MDIGGVKRPLSVDRTVIDRFEATLAKRPEALSSAGTMTALSAEEARSAKQAQRLAPRTLQVEGRELIDNVYSQTGDNITYEIGGVSFTNQEMRTCKEVVRQALSPLPAMGSDLDYRDYAGMGIAANTVQTFAAEQLSPQQAQIVNDSVAAYLDGLVQAQQARQLSSGIRAEGYYAVGGTLTHGAAETLKSQLTPAISQESRSTLLSNLSRAEEAGGVVLSAANRQTAQSVLQLFKNADLRDAASREGLFARYRELVSPAYRSVGLRDTGRGSTLTHALAQDVRLLDAQLTSAEAALKYAGGTYDRRA